MITCIAIDDEPLALKQLTNYVKKIAFLELKDTFISSVDALEYVNHQNIDLIFVDINMPDLNGMELVKSLTNPPKVIFITAYRNYAADGFTLDAADYLVKPISFSAFSKSIEKVKNRYFLEKQKSIDISKDDQFLFIKTEYKIVRVEFTNIKYIEGMRDYVRIHLIIGKPIMTLLSMKSIANTLPNNSFMRIHRSFIVNLNKITTIEKNRIIFDENVYIPVSEQYKSVFQAFVERNFLK